MLVYDDENRPVFYYPLLKDDFMQKIVIPPAFVKEHKPMLAKTCLLKSGEGIMWKANIKRDKIAYYICEGELAKFVVYHKLEVGDSLLFYLIDYSTFLVMQYTPKSSEKFYEGPMFEALSSCSEDDDDERININLPFYSGDQSVHPSMAMQNPVSGGKSNVKADYPRAPERKASALGNKAGSSRYVKGSRGLSRGKDHNKSKRPPTGYHLFLKDFKKQPRINYVGKFARAAADKWKAMTDAEKEPYQAKAVKRSILYGKQMAAAEGSSKSISDFDVEAEGVKLARDDK